MIHTSTGVGPDSAAEMSCTNTDKKNIQVTFKGFGPFTDWIREIKNSQVDNAKGLDIEMPTNNLIECSERSVRQCQKDDLNDNITDSESFKFNSEKRGKDPAAGNTKDIEIVVPLI